MRLAKNKEPKRNWLNKYHTLFKHNQWFIIESLFL